MPDSLKGMNNKMNRTEEIIRKIKDRIPRLLKKQERNHAQVWLLGGIDHNNLGDHQIVESMIEFVKDIQPACEIHEIAWSRYFDQKSYLLENIQNQDILLFCGGGNLGTLWPKTELLRRDAFATWPKNKKIVFPQSMFYEDTEEGRKELLISSSVYCDSSCIMALRDSVSYSEAKKYFKCRLYLTPDMAFYSHISGYRDARHGCLLLLRRDKERGISDEDAAFIRDTAKGFFGEAQTGDTVLDHAVTAENRKAELETLYRQICSAQLIITDRLHGMILSAISGTPCIVLPNSYHKIEASIPWVSDLPYIRYLKKPEQLPMLLGQMDLHATYEYPHAKMQAQFKEFQAAVSTVFSNTNEHLL